MPAALRLARPRTLALTACLALAGCATTGLAESWVKPDLTELPRFQKVFVAYLGQDASAQRSAEDALAKHMEHTQVVKCYELFPEAGSSPAQVDAARVTGELRAKGCDGAVILRLTRVEQEVSVTHGAYPTSYRTFGGYWGYASVPVDVHTDEIAHVETNVYSLANDELLYAARSETFNPGSAADLVDEIAEAIAEDLAEKGLSR